MDQKEFGQRQRLQRRLDLLLLTTVVAVAGLLLVALLLGLSLREQRARETRERRLARAAYELQERHLEFDLIARALSAGTEQERARSLDFFIKSGFLPASSPRLRFLSANNPAGLPYLPWATSAPIPSSPAGTPARSAPPVQRASPVRVAERPASVAREEAPAAPIPTEPAARESDTDPDAKRDVYGRAQQILRARGYYAGPVDGRFDTNTKAAVARFQRAHDLNDDGLLGPRTLRAIGELRDEKRANP